MREQFETLEYGSLYISCGGRPYPISGGDILNFSNKQGNQDIARDIESYNSCQMIAKVVGAGVEIPITGVSDINTLALILNTFIPNDTVTCSADVVLRVWDIIDPSVPTLHKVQGINTTYSRMLSGRNKGNRDGYDYNNVINPNARWNQTQYIEYLRTMWAGAWEFTSGLPPVGAWAGNPDLFRLFWTPRRWKNFYTLVPYQALRIPVGNPNRRVYDGAGPVNTTNQSIASVGPGVGRVFVVGTDNFGNYTYEFFADEFYRQDASRSPASGTSYVVGYPMLEAGTGNRSIFLKPLGMDSLYTNYFDESRYELFCTTYNADNDAYPLLTRMPISGSQRVGSLDYDHWGPWSSSIWTRKVRTFSRKYRTSKKASRVRFFLRDLVTGRISIFSRGEMRYQQTTKPMPPCFLLHVDANY